MIKFFNTSRDISQIDESISRELAEVIINFTLIPNSKLSKCKAATRLYHDLALYGEDAEYFMEDLTDVFSIDFSNFEFEKYFPYEYSPEEDGYLSLFFNFTPRDKWAFRNNGRSKYLPISLKMIDMLIKTKEWDYYLIFRLAR